MAVLDFLVERTIARNDQPRPHGLGLVGTDRFEDAFLDSSEQLGLIRRWKRINFVEKQGPVSGFGKLSGVNRICPRECSLGMPKHFALDQAC